MRRVALSRELPHGGCICSSAGTKTRQRWRCDEPMTKLVAPRPILTAAKMAIVARNEWPCAKGKLFARTATKAKPRRRAGASWKVCGGASTRKLSADRARNDRAQQGKFRRFLHEQGNRVKSFNASAHSAHARALAGREAAPRLTAVAGEI